METLRSFAPFALKKNLEPAIRYFLSFFFSNNPKNAMIYFYD